MTTCGLIYRILNFAIESCCAFNVFLRSSHDMWWPCTLFSDNIPPPSWEGVISWCQTGGLSRPGVLVGISSDILSGISSDIFYLACILLCVLTFYLANLLTCFLVCLLTSFLALYLAQRHNVWHIFLVQLFHPWTLLFTPPFFPPSTFLFHPLNIPFSPSALSFWPSTVYPFFVTLLPLVSVLVGWLVWCGLIAWYSGWWVMDRQTNVTFWLVGLLDVDGLRDTMLDGYATLSVFCLLDGWMDGWMDGWTLCR